MGPLHNIWVGMAAVGLDYFRSCTDLHHCLVLKAEVWLRLLLTGRRRFHSHQSTWPMQTGGHSWRLKVKPNFSLAPPAAWPLCPVQATPSLLCPVGEAAQSRMVPTPTLCRAALTLSLTGCIFKQLLLPKLSFKPFFFSQQSRLAQINTNYPSKLSIRLHSLSEEQIHEQSCALRRLVLSPGYFLQWSTDSAGLSSPTSADKSSCLTMNCRKFQPLTITLLIKSLWQRQHSRFVCVVLSSKSIPVLILGSKNPFFPIIEAEE